MTHDPNIGNDSGVHPESDWYSDGRPATGNEYIKSKK